MHFNEVLRDVEKTFNTLDAIPIVAIPCSLIRVLASKVQILASAAIGIIGLMGQIVFSDTKKWEALTKGAGESFVHGVLNLIRGVAELCLSVTIVGSLVPLAYQSFSPNKFNPVRKYETN